MDKTNAKVVYLTVSNMDANTVYSLVCASLKDKQNQTVTGETNTFSGYGSSDTTPPEITITEPVENQLLSTIFHIYGTASDNSGIKNIEIKVDGDTYIGANGTVNWYYDLNTSAANEAVSHLIYAKATDLKGNSKVASVTVNVDRTAPVFTVNTAPAAGILKINSGSLLQFAGTAMDANNISLIYIYVTNMYTNRIYTATWTGVSNWTFDYSQTTVHQDECSNKFMFVAIDTAGNKVAISKNYIIYRDSCIYVRTNGSDTADGTWWKPLKTIAYGQSKASSISLNNVLVAEGIYTNNVGNTFARKIIGGYNQDFSTLYATNYKTEVKPANGIYFSSGYISIYNCKLIGFIRFALNESYYLSNCYIMYSNNTFTAAYPSGENNQFYDNFITGYGPFFKFNVNGVTGSLYFENNIVSNVNLNGQNFIVFDRTNSGSYYSSGYASIKNNEFYNLTNGQYIIRLGSSSSGSSALYNDLYYLNGNLFKNNKLSCVYLQQYFSVMAASTSNVITFLSNQFIGNKSKYLLYIYRSESASTDTKGHMYINLKYNVFNSITTNIIQLYNNNTNKGKFKLDIEYNQFLGTNKFCIMESNTYASPITAVATNYFNPLIIGGGALYKDANGGGNRNTVAEVNTLDDSPFYNPAGTCWGNY